ncbi:16S rRNA (guanine(527)-N(7))-methyltransferase RsmG [Coralliovum pocilloporae]|uniref:16S rRNA (guanine(527)-N(7))-methyltransferase RsmG n=1 Tax=Coralliovum pocilloporae TaxID=3066369 RepID=UPI003307A004
MNSEACFRVIESRYSVSRETKDRLEHYVSLVRKWQPAQNLISPKTLDQIWQRHVLDSAQLVMMKPEARTWLDIGSGAGFPGLVTAILMMEKEEGGHVVLVESNERKVAFLRTVIRETGCSAQVINGRIETVLADFDQQVDVISARALASFRQLCGFIQPVMTGQTSALFHKGREFAAEIEEASDEWVFDLLQHKSIVDDDSVIAEVRSLSPMTDISLVQ